MATRFFLYHLDRTTCGGRILSGAEDDTYEVGGVLKVWAGSLDSYSSCPCRARFIPSVETHTYGRDCNAGLAAERAQAADGLRYGRE